MRNEKSLGGFFPLSALLAAGLAAGCSTDGYQVEAAVKACAAHGGVTEMVHDIGYRHARCMDGSYFRNVGDEK